MLTGRVVPRHDADPDSNTGPTRFYGNPPEFLRTDQRPACAGVDPEIFFPGRGGNGGAGKHNERAKQICATCPLREDCLEWALRDQSLHGIWGGLTETERGRLRGRTRRVAALENLRLVQRAVAVGARPGTR